MVNRLAFLVVFLLLPFVLKAQGNRVAIYHQVQDGDNYGKIAPLYNTKVDSLLKWNPEVDPKKLKLGKRIIVGWKEVVKEQESEEKRKENTDMTQGSKAGQPIGDTNVTKEEPMPNPQPSPQINPKPNPNPRPNPKPKNPNDGPTPPRSYSWVWLLLGVLVGLVLGGVLVYLMLVKKLKTELEYTENELSRAKFDLSGEKTKNNTELSRLSSKIQTLERENSRLLDENVSLGEEMDRLRETQSRVRETKTENTVTTSANQVSNPTTEPSTTLYADAIIDEYFVKTRETLNEDSIFVLHLNGENSADFSIHKSAYQRVLANPSFLEGCEKQILGDTMQLEILSEGKAQREASNGKWKVINKLNVIIR